MIHRHPYLIVTALLIGFAIGIPFGWQLHERVIPSGFTQINTP